MRTFFTSIVEYWIKVDMHRVAKYMSLIRYALHESFVFLRDTCHYEHINRFNAVMRDGPLAAHTKKHLTSIAVMTHVIDIFVEEAEKVFARNESSKIYAVDEDIDYDNADVKIEESNVSGKDAEKKKRDVEVISSENMLKLLEPFFEVYADTSMDSVIVAFDKTMWRQLEEYKELDLSIVDIVKRNKLLAKHRKGAFVTADLHHTQQYARPAKGSLDLDLNAISNKFLEYANRKKFVIACQS